MGTILVCTFLVVGLINVLTVRYLTLPTAFRKAEPVTAQQAAMTGYASATAPAIFGSAAAVMTGQSLMILPFAVLTLIGFYAVWSFLQEHPAPPEPTGGGWRYRERGR
jgi:hypothetical protein